MKHFSAAFLTIVVSGCAPLGLFAHKELDVIPVRYSVVDDIENKKFQLTYINDNGKKICLNQISWPFSGIVNSYDIPIYVEIGQEKFNLEKRQDYCPKCEVPIAPGATAKGHFNYSVFGIPESLSRSPKKLVFTPSPTYFCR